MAEIQSPAKDSVDAPSSPEQVQVAASPVRSAMNLGGSALGAAGGGGAACVISYFWNWIAVRDWGAPPMDISDATALATLIAPVIAWLIGFLPMPKVRNRRV